MSVFDSFVKKRDYLLCVDSDGCAMDTMNCKHIHCFGPALVTEWALENWEEEVLRIWNNINLFQMTRGINRFRSLALALGEIQGKFTPIAGLQTLERWVDTTPALSNEELDLAISRTEDPDGRLILSKALSWSLAVNENITRLPEELKKPFAGAREALAVAAEFADVAVVSSGHRDAVEEEWQRYGLLPHADILLTQDCGDQIHSIRQMLGFGYDPRRVLMVGDAPEDCLAAEECGILFYPILVNWEEESWEDFRENILPAFQMLEYPALQEEKKQVFRENLGG